MKTSFNGKAAKTALSFAWAFGLLIALWGLITSDAAFAAIVFNGDVDPPDPANWNLDTNGYVGKTGTGEVTVDGGDALNSKYCYVGDKAGSTGQVTADGAGTTWTSSSYLYVGHYGSGTFSISGGGTVSSQYGYVGTWSGSTGAFTVHGAGSTWNISKLLYVGNAGDGTLEITGGGVVNSTSTVTIGNNSTTSPLNQGKVTVDGTGSKLTTNAPLTVGAFQGSIGELIVTGGGEVSNTVGKVGSSAGATGAVRIEGLGSKWINSGDLRVGNSGSGTLTIAAGGEVSNAAGYIGANAGATGTVTVDGSGSKWTNTTSLTIGAAGTGTLNVSNGGTLCANTITGGVSIVTVNFDNGVLKPYNAANATWLSVGTHADSGVWIKEGGAVFDTAGYDMAIGVALQHGGISPIDGGLTKRGAGTLTLTGANPYTGRTVLQQATLQLGPAAHNTVLSLGGADIETQTGKLIFDYTGGSSPAATIGGLLAASYATGWTSGQFICSLADAGHGLGWMDDTGAQQVIVQYAIYGDANLDTTVNNDDLFILLGNLGQSSMTWSQGDFDNNGAVNNDDLFTLLGNLGSSGLDSATIEMLKALGVPAAMIPEPGTLVLLVGGLVGLLCYAWRRRR